MTSSDKLFAHTSPARIFLLAAIPGAVSMLASSLYQTLDGMFVGQGLGSTAFAAINLAMPFVIINFAVADLIGVGSSVPISISLGQGRRDDADQIFSSSVLMIIAASTVLGAFMFLLAPALMTLMGAEGDFHRLATQYLRVYAAFSPVTTLVFATDNYMRICGKTQSSMWLNIFMSCCSATLEFLFIIVLGGGVWAAALGTCLSMAISLAIAIMPFILGRRNLRFVRFRSEWKSLGHSMTNGSSEMMSELSTGIATLLFNLISMRLYQEEGVAAVTVVMYVYYFFIAFYMGLAVSAAPVISYDYGAGDEKAIRRMLSLSVKTILASSAVIFLFALLSSSLISSIFGTGELCIRALVLTSPVYLFCGINVFFSSYFTALSDGLSSAVISTLRSLIFVAAFIFILPLAIGGDGLWLTLAAADAATIPVTLFLYFRKGRVRKNSRGELVRAAD